LPEGISVTADAAQALDGAALILLVVPALFAIVNPPGAAFIFNEVTAHLTAAQRRVLSDKVAFYSLGVMLGALWLGSYILEFFGISLAALRIAGGAVVAVRAFDLLNAPERTEARKQQQAESGTGEDITAMAFFPLTLPFTTGPGTIAVCVALGAQRPAAAGGASCCSARGKPAPKPPAWPAPTRPSAPPATCPPRWRPRPPATPTWRRACRRSARTWRPWLRPRPPATARRACVRWPRLGGGGGTSRTTG
jgi:MarC family membrane protein